MGANANLTSRGLEVHDLTFAMGELLIFYYAFGKRHSHRRLILLLAGGFFLLGWKRSAIPGVLLSCGVGIACEKMPEKKAMRLITTAGMFMILLAYLYIYVVREGIVEWLTKTYDIDMMGRNELYAWIGKYYEFKPSFMGQGIGFITEIMKEAIESHTSVLNHELSIHSDILARYIELGFVGNLLWSALTYIYTYYYIVRHQSARAGTLYFSLLIYCYITYFTDNTVSYYHINLALRMLPIAYTFAHQKQAQDMLTPPRMLSWPPGSGNRSLQEPHKKPNRKEHGHGRRRKIRKAAGSGKQAGGKYGGRGTEKRIGRGQKTGKTVRIEKEGKAKKRKRTAQGEAELAAAAVDHSADRGGLVFASSAADRHQPFHVSFYSFEEKKIESPMRIAFLSDMHLNTFGKDNEDLTAAIRKLEPDIIVIGGDMNIMNNPDYSAVLTLCRQLVEIAPVYYGMGNHEYTDILFNGSNILTDLSALGVNTLSNRYMTIQVNGNLIDIGGLSETMDQFEKYGVKFWNKYDGHAKNYRLLLVHDPGYFRAKGALVGKNIDLALCGHLRGIILLVIGALYHVNRETNFQAFSQLCCRHSCC